MRYGLMVLWVLLWSVSSTIAQVSVGIGLPGVSIGINLPLYPELVQVPGYPVYYAPRLDSNFFFYDGMYWVYQRDSWYASSWYNGPWWLVGPEVVPLFMLRIPVRYYRAPPVYFRGWRPDSPPRWGDHWGHDWQQRRSGWDRWNRNSAPAPAPLPAYQRQYSGDRYPGAEQQRALHSQNYRFQPRSPVVRQHYQEQAVQRAPAPSHPGQQGAPRERSPRQEIQRPNPPPLQQNRPTVPQRGDIQREQQSPGSSRESSPQGRGAPQEPGREQGQERGRAKDEDRGQDRGQGRERGQERSR
jgi:hypothetical protein